MTATDPNASGSFVPTPDHPTPYQRWYQGNWWVWTGTEWTIDTRPAADRMPPVGPIAPAAVAVKPKSRGRMVLMALGLFIVLFIVLAGIGAALSGGKKPAASTSLSSSPSSSASSSSAAPSTSTTTTPPPPPAYTPTPADFKITVHILSKDCFGSAGCNVTYRIQPVYKGEPLTSDQSETITYTVLGGEDPQQGNFTMTGMEASFSSEEIISTKTSKVNLTVRVDEVLPN